MAIIKKPQQIKHNRKILPKDEEYGEVATYDILATCICAYELKEILDANGKKVVMDKKWLKRIEESTNNFIETRVNSKFKKVKSFLQNKDNSLIIPLSFDHESSAKHVVGFTQGLSWIEEFEGKDTLFINVLAIDNETKAKINDGLLRHTSIGIRPDGSIKEISFVQNPALPDGGIILSENKIENLLSEQELELQEQISTLEFQETQLSEFTIPNHIIFLRMLKNGKIRPTAYNEFITKHPEDNMFMEKMSPVQDLGIIYGSSLQPTMVLDEHKEKVIEYAEQFLGWRNKKKKKLTTEEIKEDIQLQYREPDIALHYKNILKEIKDLNKVCPQLVDDVIATELGENKNQNLPNDNELNEYLAQLEEIKTKKQNLTIQLQEQKLCQFGKQN
jgi:hypothetical protein